MMYVEAFDGSMGVKELIALFGSWLSCGVFLIAGVLLSRWIDDETMFDKRSPL